MYGNRVNEKGVFVNEKRKVPWDDLFWAMDEVGATVRMELTVSQEIEDDDYIFNIDGEGMMDLTFCAKKASFNLTIQYRFDPSGHPYPNLGDVIDVEFPASELMKARKQEDKFYFTVTAEKVGIHCP